MITKSGQKPIRVDEDSRLNLSVKLLKGVLVAVAAGPTLAAGVFFLALSIKDDMKEVKQTIHDHERRLIKIDVHTVTHTDSGKTVTQSAVTRDSSGNVIAQPTLTITL